MRLATKTDLERHDEEAERLVRPSPKQKPPRHDLRRERIETERDPDLVDSSDSRDRSKNFKHIGGSVARLLRRAREELVPAKSRETGRVVQVSPETLKESPGKYEPVDESEESNPQDSSRTKFYQDAGNALHALAQDNPKLENKLKDFSRPDSQISGLAKENPDFPAARLFPGVTLPEGLKTLGDVKEALANAVKPKRKKKPKEKAPSTEPGQSETAPSPKEPEPKEEPAKEDPAKKEGPSEDAPQEAQPVAPPKQKRPERRPVSEEERQAAQTLLVDTFPPEVASELIAKDYHPDDVRELVRTYGSAKLGGPKNLDRLVTSVSQVYQLDPDKVPPPVEGKNSKGVTVSYDQLTPEEQAEATLRHQIQVTSLSLAARDVLTSKLSQKGALTGRARVPETLASALADTILRPGTPTAAEEVFRSTVADGGEVIKPKAAKALLSHVAKYPGARDVALAYMQAADYTKAKEEFLDTAEISEWDRPGKIVSGLDKAERFFRDRGEAYGLGTEHLAARLFRQRVVGRLSALDPEKGKAVRARLAELEKREYADQVTAWKKAMQEHLQRKQEHAQAQAQYLANPEGKDPPGPFAEDPPREPTKPAYGFDQEEGSSLWSTLTGLGKRSKKPVSVEVAVDKAWDEAQTKIASGSSYSSSSMMASTAKTSVYHGVDPNAGRPGGYPGWQQFQLRDFSDQDAQAILASAREWLASPLRSVATKGSDADAEYRAALDLALYAGPYNGAIPANTYNELLSRLKGASKTAHFRVDDLFLAVYGLKPIEASALKDLGSPCFSFVDLTGNTFSDGNLAAHLVRQGSTEVSPGYLCESLLRVDFPEGCAEQALRLASETLAALGLGCEKVASSYIPSSRKAPDPSPSELSGELGRKAAAKIREFATRVAASNASLSFDLLAFAKDLEVPQEPRTKATSNLRSLIIKQALSVPESERGPWQPVLQALKGL